MAGPSLGWSGASAGRLIVSIVLKIDSALVVELTGAAAAPGLGGVARVARGAAGIERQRFGEAAVVTADQGL